MIFTPVNSKKFEYKMNDLGCDAGLVGNDVKQYYHNLEIEMFKDKNTLND